MKQTLLFSTSILAAVALLAGCNTPNTRRDVYSPSKGKGPYSEALRDGTWKEGVKAKPVEKADEKKADPAPEPEAVVPAA